MDNEMEARFIVPLKQIEYGAYEDLMKCGLKAIFYLLKGDYIHGSKVKPFFDGARFCGIRAIRQVFFSIVENRMRPGLPGGLQRHCM